MIASITGKIVTVGSDHVVVGVGGVGVRLFVPKTALQSLVPGGRISYYTHLIVRETELTLYGFESSEDLALFEILLGVNGVGPKVALAILSTLSPELLKGAIMREEPAVLQRVPGIGKKTAQRIMFHLRDKLDFGDESGTLPLVSDIDADVIDVLTTLGFSIVEAQSALQRLPRDLTDVNERVAAALQLLDS